MNAMLHDDVTPAVAAVLETLPLSIAVLRDDGSLCYANAPARRLAAVIHSDPARGLARLTAGQPDCGQGTDCAGDCEDCLQCAGEDGNPLVVVRQWRPCGNTGLRSVTIRPARGEATHPLAGAAATHPLAGAAAIDPRTANDPQSLLHADKLATVGQLAAGMAHEINNPICYVQSNLGTFRDYVNKLFGLLELGDELSRDARLDVGERQRLLEARKRSIDFAAIVQDLPALLEESREGVERIRRIVQNLRDFSRTDPGDAFQLFDVRRALDTTLDIVRSLSGPGLRCATHFEALPLIECNPTELNQLFMNILVNATQAIDEHGHVEIHTRAAGKEHVEISIGDDGCGMDEAVLGHIFEPFFTTKGVGKGTGLGLSISYGIVKKHAGEIVVRSAPGRGTTFQITLPVKQPQHLQPPQLH